MAANVGKGFDKGEVYKGKVLDQTLAKNSNGETQLVLTVRIDQRLKNPRDTVEGTEPCQPSEQEVRVTFAEDEERLRMAVRDLERLGFSDDDVSRLHPDHPDCISLVNKEIHVRMHVSGALEYWNLCWPSSTLRGEEAMVAAASLKERITAAKKKTMRGGKKGTGGSDAPTDQPTTPGGAS